MNKFIAAILILCGSVINADQQKKQDDISLTENLVLIYFAQSKEKLGAKFPKYLENDGIYNDVIEYTTEIDGVNTQSLRVAHARSNIEKRLVTVMSYFPWDFYEKHGSLAYKKDKYTICSAPEEVRVVGSGDKVEGQRKVECVTCVPNKIWFQILKEFHGPSQFPRYEDKSVEEKKEQQKEIVLEKNAEQNEPDQAPEKVAQENQENTGESKN